MDQRGHDAVCKALRNGLTTHRVFPTFCGVKIVTPLKIAIVQSGRPQREIAAALDMHPSHLSRIVNGLHADERTQEALARELDRRVADLFGEQELQAAA